MKKVNLPFYTPAEMVRNYRLVKTIDRGNRYLHHLRTRNPYCYSDLGYTPPKPQKTYKIVQIAKKAVDFVKRNFFFCD